MDPKRGAMILAGLAFVIAVISIAGYSLFNNLVLDSWFTTMRPKAYDGQTVTPVQSFRHEGNTITFSERPFTKVQADRSRIVIRYLVVDFNGIRLEQGDLPIIPAEQASLKVHYLIQPKAQSETPVPVQTAVVEEEMAAAGPSYQSQRNMERPDVYLFAPPPDFDEAKFNQLVACWVANAGSINRCLEKSNFVPAGGGSPVPFDVKAVNGLALGTPPPVRTYVSDQPGRFYEGSVETLTVQPNGRWNITGTVGPVSAPLESGIVQIRDGQPYLWATYLPSLEGPDGTGVALADHLNTFHDGHGARVTNLYKVDPFKLVQPTVEEEIRAQARKLGIKALPAPLPGLDSTLNPGAGTANPGVSQRPGIESLPGYNPMDPQFQNENPSGLPPESNPQAIPDRPLPY